MDAVIAAARLRLEAERNQASAALKAIPGIGSGALGLTPDSVRAAQAYQAARQAYQRAHEALRRFNAVYGRSTPQP